MPKLFYSKNEQNAHVTLENLLLSSNATQNKQLKIRLRKQFLFFVGFSVWRLCQY